MTMPERDKAGRPSSTCQADAVQADSRIPPAPSARTPQNRPQMGRKDVDFP